jgi:hypothetical protein
MLLYTLSLCCPVLVCLLYTLKQCSTQQFPHIRTKGSAAAFVKGVAVRMELGPDHASTSTSSGASQCSRLNVKLTRLDVTVQEVKVVITGSRLSGLYNLVADAFDGTVRSYVASQLEAAIRANVSRFLDLLNEQVGDHWPLLRQIAEGNPLFRNCACPESTAATTAAAASAAAAAAVHALPPQQQQQQLQLQCSPTLERKTLQWASSKKRKSGTAAAGKSSIGYSSHGSGFEADSSNGTQQQQQQRRRSKLSVKLRAGVTRQDSATDITAAAAAAAPKLRALHSHSHSHSSSSLGFRRKLRLRSASLNDEVLPIADAAAGSSSSSSGLLSLGHGSGSTEDSSVLDESYKTLPLPPRSSVDEGSHEQPQTQQQQQQQQAQRSDHTQLPPAAPQLQRPLSQQYSKRHLHTLLRRHSSDTSPPPSQQLSASMSSATGTTDTALAAAAAEPHHWRLGSSSLHNTSSKKSKFRKLLRRISSTSLGSNGSSSKHSQSAAEFDSDLGEECDPAF